MSESIAEMVIPGTYIEVRAEGLIGVGGISTGNVGVVGSAAKGPVNTPMLLGSYADALDVFGAYDSAIQSSTPGPSPGDPPVPGAVPLTLTRAVEQAFLGGASTVIAVRAANGTVVKAARVLKDGAADAFTLTAKEGGTWGNQMKIGVVAGDTAGTFKLALTFANVTETYTGTPAAIQAAIQAESRLVDASATPTTATGLTAIDPPTAFGTATGTGNALGNDQSSLTAIEFKAGLAALVDQPVNIVLVANGTATLDLKGVVGAHLEETENQGRERIAVLGAGNPGSATDVSPVTAETATVANDRIILVAPGVVYTDPGTGKPHNLPPSYLAAAVAGKLAAQAPHVSLTNKALDVDGVSVVYGAPATKTLLGARVLVVRPKFGFQVVKGITTDNGAFRQISVRRTIDFAKAGVRLGADPYIGRLNNARVRAALKATLDGFLSQMVLDEMLVEYELAVTATRAQEIAGICAVAMTLKPTFSIDYIRVTMTLQ